MTVIFESCKTTATSMLIADSYDKKTDATTLMLFPFGNIIIPGKWTKTEFNSSSKQHFFRDEDSTTIAVSKNPQNKYPFYTKDMTDKEFTVRYYEWESTYYSQKGLKSLILADSIDNGNFIVWKIEGDSVNTILLYAGKDKFAYGFSFITDKVADQRRVDFLTKLFKDN